MQPGRSIKYQNKNIYYRVIGKGKPVVLLHGFGEDGNIWNKIIEEIENDYCFIIPHIPGSGKSEMLDGNISIEDYAEVIKAILNEEIFFGEICIIGHSMGGYIALAFAEKYPSLLSGLGLFHSSAFADDEEKIKTRLKGIEFIKKNGAYTFLRSSVPNLFADNEHHTEIELLIENGKNFSAETLIQYYGVMIKRPDRTNVLRSFNKPVLFLIGEKDLAVPLKISLQQCYLPATSYVHILENSAHMGMIEQTAKCSTAMENYLQNI